MRLTHPMAFVSYVMTTITSASATFPQLGPYPVSLSNIALQTSRDDALSPKNDTKRRLMLSVFQPQISSLACANASHFAYMPEKTARIMEKQEPGGVPLSQISGLDFAALEVEYCAPAHDDESGSPILLFQPGYQASRFAYQLYLSAIASSGYTVVSMDITYECPIVEFEDGSTVVNNTGVSPDGLGPNESLPVRAQDFLSVIDAIESGSLTVGGLHAPVSPSQKEKKSGDGEVKTRIGVFGHSIGGAASLLAASLDSRISAVIDWDGQIFQAQINATLSTPTLLFQRESPLEGHVEGWEYAWDNLLRGDTKAWIALNGTQHLSFTDLPTVIETEGLRDTRNKDGVLAVGGVIAPRRLGVVVWTWSVAWFDRVLKGKKDGLFFGAKTSTEFPDVRFIK
ncbi:hypothetical protein DM02DRAFT_612811 [Periconia macrospinosa]|uniref:1-alkyl-2-acetylglycerophosphocholine esterase n=1 Tax=Periconia macrospinosa TaxID=97972 RepID=A0A2V1DX07_9PLEO|nr:hypothetical protein DM02DRAFT_612811 [Periconia macrospinosa]